MSVVYTPINGNAGTVSVSLVNRETGAVQGDIISLDIIEFDEEDEESEFNEIITNINDELVKNHFGHRKRISFSVVNAGVMGEANLARIFRLIQVLNIVNSDQETYRLSIQFRGSDAAGVMADAIYSGNLRLNEVSSSANIGQTIQFEFRSKTAGALDYAMNAFFQYVLLENDGGKVMLEDGGLAMLEAYDIRGGNSG